MVRRGAGGDFKVNAELTQRPACHGGLADELRTKAGRRPAAARRPAALAVAALLAAARAAPRLPAAAAATATAAAVMAAAAAATALRVHDGASGPARRRRKERPRHVGRPHGLHSALGRVGVRRERRRRRLPGLHKVYIAEPCKSINKYRARSPPSRSQGI